jgi:hypothetical protein
MVPICAANFEVHTASNAAVNMAECLDLPIRATHYVERKIAMRKSTVQGIILAVMCVLDHAGLGTGASNPSWRSAPVAVFYY